MKDYNQIYLKRTKKIGYLLQNVPFLRALLLNGSLATGRAKASSDIDLLIISSDNRLWTVRFLVLVLAQLFGFKRSSDEKKNHAGKACFNYFLTESFLKIPTGRGQKIDQYCANNYSNSILISGDQKIFNRFFKVNDGLFDLAAKIETKQILSFPLNNIRIFQLVRKTKEFLFKGRLGDLIEDFLMKLQTNRIKKDQRTKMYPNLIVFNKKEARFHPPKHWIF